MRIERGLYLNRLISKMHNGKVKIITGIRRCGKSYLLRHIFKDYLLENGVQADHILEIALDQKEFEKYRNPNALYDYVLHHISGGGDYFLFVDEIQLSYKVKREDADLNKIAKEDQDLAYTTFYDILNDLMAKPNLDIYVTGSNSRMLSKDIATNFRDRGSEIRMFPLSFSEFYAMSGAEKADAWAEYVVYGGMPLAVLEPNESERANYLSGLFERVYIADVAERYGVEDAYLGSLIDVVASSVGSLTNPRKLANTLNSVHHANTSDKTVKKYLDAATRWWNQHVLTGISPDYDETADAETLKALCTAHVMPDTPLQDLIAEGEALQAQIEEVEAQLKEPNKRLKAIKETIRERLKESLSPTTDHAELTGGKYVWKLACIQSETVDTDALEADGLFEKYSRPTTTYRMTLKKREGE